ncbi:MAG: response regulator transcription factor [Gammaproteobacteria bacterium]|nr:response regulator transcription factor [Gammaproteobacteria bacterium]MBI5619184.1 response regulator transcription factor [Gammaproteobacteria bacterium]
MIRVLVVDDHAVVRAGLRQFFNDVGDIEIADEAASADAAVRMLRQSEYDVVLLDISMPDKSGVEALKQMKRDHPSVPVLMLSMHPESRYAVQLLRHGASGYLQKEAMPTELVSAIRTIHRGRRYITPALAELLASELDRADDRPLHECLSDRERQVFMSLAKGEAVSAIAENLHLSIKTISTYRARVLEKMKVASNADLTYYAIKNDLID